MDNLVKENKNLVLGEEILSEEKKGVWRFKKTVSFLIIASTVLNMMMPAFVYPFQLKNSIPDLKLFEIFDQKKFEETIFKLLLAAPAGAQMPGPGANVPVPGAQGAALRTHLQEKANERKAAGNVKVWDQILEGIQKAGQALMKALDTKRRTEELVDQSLKNVVWVALKQSLHNMLNTFAYDTATWLATGALGEKPMFYDVNWGDYMVGLLDSAAGDFIDRLSSSWLGFSICDPSDFSLKIRIGLGIAETRRPRQPDCSMTKMIKNWESLVNDPNFLDRFSVVFDPHKNDLGIAITMFQKYNEHVESNWWRGLLQRMGDKESKGVISKISEKIFTPSFLVSEQGKELLRSAKDADYEKVKFGDILLDAVSTFVNTLAGKLFEELFKKGLAAVYGKGDSSRDSKDSFSFPRLPGFPSFSRPSNDLYVGDSGIDFYSGKQAAQARFIDFLNAGITEGGIYDVLTKFNSCPNPNNPGTDECVILSGFRQAIDKQLTVSQAIQLGYLDGNKPFGVMEFKGLESLYNSIPYRSLLILRSHRVIPVTWEIAALAIEKFDKGVAKSLNELIGLFNNKSSVYYGLIDPDWVLKMPEHFCKAQGYGEKILYDEIVEGIDSDGDGTYGGPDDIPPIRMVGRSQYCADFQSCLKEDEDGSCFWGYCMEERRIWNLDASSCPKEFNTCQTFQGRAGNIFSVLQNTLDFGSCNMNNVGCLWYCQSYNPISKVWDCTNQGERILKTCASSEVGADGVAGCPIRVECKVDAGQSNCVDLINNIEVNISEPCHSGSKWWDDSIGGCKIEGNKVSCTIPRGGVHCIVTGCENLDNLLPNSGFEIPPASRVSGVDPFDIADKWKINESDINYFTLAYGENEMIHSGSNSLRFYNNGTRIQAKSFSDNISLDVGKSYTFSGKVYSRLIAGKVMIRVNGRERLITERREGWQTVTFDFTGTTSTKVEIIIFGGESPEEEEKEKGQVAGTVWFDDFKITESCVTNPLRLTLIGTADKDQSKLHLDRDSSQCPADAAGCSEFIRTKVGLGTNLVKNSSFEIWPDGQMFPTGFSSQNTWDSQNRIEKSFDSFSDSLSLKLTRGSVNLEVQSDSIVGMKPNTTYRVSFWARSDSEFPANNSGWYSRIIYKIGNNEKSDNLIINNRKELHIYPTWQRYIFDSYVTKVNGSDFKLSFVNNTQNNVPIYIDAVQIEEVPRLNPYFSEYKNYGQANLTYIKKAPEFLGCRGYTKERPSPYVVSGVTTKEQCKGETLVWQKFCIGESNNGKACNNDSDCLEAGSCIPRNCEGEQCCRQIDPLECFNYSPYCFADEAGCNSYTPLTGGPEIPAIVRYDDYCPAECIGYNSYKQSATFFENRETLDFFIPATAVSCNASEAGCDEFTNLDEVSRGGEGREYYKYLRMCKKPQEQNANCKTFYSWQGSSEAGYQLKTYILSTDPSAANPNAPKDVIRVNDIESWPNEWCSDKTIDSVTGLPNCCNGPQDLQSNPFCRELYDITGAIHYKIYQNTVSCSENCHPFRKTRLGESDIDAQENCLNSNGSWDDENRVCIYQGIPGEGLKCSAQAVGCREYRGNAGANIFTAFFEGFEKGTEAGWRTGQIQSEALSVAGHSIRSQDKNLRTISGKLDNVCDDLTFPACDNNNPTAFNCYDKMSNTCKAKDELRSDVCSVRIGEQYCGLFGQVIRPSKTYLISFWAKSASASIVQNLEIKFETASTPVKRDILTLNKINIQPEWDYYLFGPYKPENIIRDDGSIDPSIYINFVSESGDFYLDNLRIQEVRDYIYVNKGSWKTPQSCDQNPWVDNGPIRAPQFMLGCRQYNDFSGLTHNLKSFSRLCRESAVGCEAMIDTYNSTSPFSQTFNQNDIHVSRSGEETDFSVVIPADKFVYIVNRPQYQCLSANKGCQPLGLPSISPEDEVVSYSTIYKINNPDDYANSLCRHSEVGCEEFLSGNRFSYFKTPGNKTCEYRIIPGQTKSAWFKTNSTSLNPDCPIIQPPLGSVHPKDGWVGLCPPEYSSCSQFIDPTTKFGKNIIFNYDFGFNISQHPDGVPDGWYRAPGSGEIGLWQKIRVQGGRLYVLGITSAGNPNYYDPIEGYAKIPWLKDSELEFEIRGCEAITSFDHSLIEQKYCVNNVRYCTDKVTGISNGMRCNNSQDCPPANPATAPGGYTCRQSELFGEPIVLEGNRINCDINNDCGADGRCTRSLILPSQVYKSDDRTNENISGLRGEREYTARFFSPWDQYCEIRVAGKRSIFEDTSKFVKIAKESISQISVRESLVSYALNDTVDKVSCSGLVDEKAGCVLFNDRSYVNYRVGEDDISYLTFDADVSGRASQNELINKGVAVTESDSFAFRLNSNVVLKVIPDRECEAWIYPNSFTNFSEKEVERSFSTSIVTCNEFNRNGECVSFILNNSKMGYCRRTINGTPSSVCANDSECSPGFSCFRERFDYYSDPEQIKNLSGYSKPGFRFKKGVCMEGGNSGRECISDMDCLSIPGSCNKSIDGFFSFSEMSQEGEIVFSPMSSFEIGSVKPYGWNLGNPLNLLKPISNFSKMEWKIEYSKLINNPVSAQQEGLNPNAPEGQGFVKINGPFTIESEEIEIFGNVEYTISAYINTSKLLKGNAVVRLKEFNSSGHQIHERKLLEYDSGNDWSILSKKFTTNDQTIKAVIALSNWDHDNLTYHDRVIGASYFDEVKLRPALQVSASPEKYIMPTCRIYPATNSLSCDYYTDKNYQLRGWLGYCLEPDPANSKQCLVWWPVDLIKGGFAPEESLNIPSPLYYCLGAKEGRYYLNSCLFQSGKLCAAVGSLSSNPNPLQRSFSWEPPADWRIEDWQIENITVSATVTDCIGGRECNDVSPGGRLNPVARMRLFKSPNERFAWVGGDGLKAALNYNSSGILERIDFEAILDNCFCENIDITFVLKRVWCKDLVQVVTPFGQNKAWSYRISDEGSSRFIVPGLGYVDSTDYRPFGAVVPPNPSDNPASWDLSNDIWIRPLTVGRIQSDIFSSNPYQARAGTPYACTQSSSIFKGQSCSYPSTLIDGYSNIINWSNDPSTAGYSLEKYFIPKAQDSLKRLFARSYGHWEFQGYGICKDENGYIMGDGVPCSCPESVCAKTSDIRFKACGQGVCSYYDENGRISPDPNDLESLVPKNIRNCINDEECKPSCVNGKCLGTSGISCTVNGDCPQSFCVSTGQACEVGIVGCLSLKDIIKKAVKIITQTFFTDGFFDLGFAIVMIIIKLILSLLTSCGPKNCDIDNPCGPGEGECLSFINWLFYKFGLSAEDPNALDWLFQVVIYPIIAGASEYGNSPSSSDDKGFDIQQLLDIVSGGSVTEAIWESNFGVFAFIADIFGAELRTFAGSFCTQTSNRCRGSKNPLARCCWFTSCNTYVSEQYSCVGGPNKGMICNPDGDNCGSGYCKLKDNNSSYVKTDQYLWQEPKDMFLCDAKSSGINKRPTGYCSGGINDGQPCFSSETCVGLAGRCNNTGDLCITTGQQRYTPFLSFESGECNVSSHTCIVDYGNYTGNSLPNDRPSLEMVCTAGEVCVRVINKTLNSVGFEIPWEKYAGNCVEDGSNTYCVITAYEYRPKYNGADICVDYHNTWDCNTLPNWQPCKSGEIWDGTFCNINQGINVGSSDCGGSNDKWKFCRSNATCVDSDFNKIVEDSSVSDRFGDYYDYCAVAPKVSYMAVNGKESLSTNILSSGSIALSFAVTVDPNQMPLKGYVIDWGDGTNTSVSGQSLSVRFDKSNPFTATHFYSYWDLLAADQAGNLWCGEDSPCCKEQACAVVPRIQVRDNWSWCNASLRCSNTASGLGTGRYCYGDEYCPAGQFCRPVSSNPIGNLNWGHYGKNCQNNQNAWQPFAGRIIVSP